MALPRCFFYHGWRNVDHRCGCRPLTQGTHKGNEKTFFKDVGLSVCDACWGAGCMHYILV